MRYVRGNIEIYRTEGSLVEQIIGEREIYNIFGYFNDGEYINYNDTYISLTRLNYNNSTVEIFENSRNPGQLVGGFIDGFVTQISGITINESIVYDNDCLSRGRAINNFIERSDICTFNLPSFYISGATKIGLTGITSASTGVYIVDTLSTLTFSAIFTDHIEFFTANTNNAIKFELYRRTTPTIVVENFPAVGLPYLSPIVVNPIFGKNLFDTTEYYTVSDFNISISGYSGYSSYSGYSGVTFVYDLTDVEGEFVIKGLYKWLNCTYFSRLSGTEYIQSFVGGLYPYYLYDNSRDYYFIHLERAQKPTIYSNIIASDTPPLNVYSFKPNCDGQTTFPLENINLLNGENGLLVSVNGVVLSLDEYDFASNTLTITGGTILATDTITVAFSNDANTPPIQTESYTITSIPNTTYPSFGQKVIFNTSKNKYEYWLDYEVVSDPIFTVNGQVLSDQIDYYVSSSNRRRIILEDTLSVGDIITVFYNSIMKNGTSIESRQFYLSWTLPKVVKNNLGYFLVQVSNYGDYNFTSPIFNEVIFYQTNVASYITTVYFTGGTYGDKFIAKITNFKNYYTVLGELIQTSEVSEIIPFTITTNALNNY